MPRLAYDDPASAIEYLCRCFGFEETGRFAPHGQIVQAELAYDGVTVMSLGAAYDNARSPNELGAMSVELFCYVEDVDAHHARALSEGARIVEGPVDKFWGNRSYNALDSEGHRWTSSARSPTSTSDSRASHQLGEGSS